MQSRALHPENDWLWFAAEYGLPALLLALAGILILFRQAAPGKNLEGWVTRAAAASAVLAFLLHGCVDVPGHRIGTVWLGLTLAGLAFGRKRQAEAASPSPVWVPLSLRALSLTCALAGIVWTLGVVLDGPWPVSVATERAQARIVSGWRSQELEKSLAECERALIRMPLEENLHFLYGKNLLFFQDSDREAAREFGLQRKLEPFRMTVLTDQALAWAEWRPQDPAPALECLQAALDLFEKMPDSSDRSALLLNGVSAVLRICPSLRTAVITQLANHPDLLARWLSESRAEDFLAVGTALRASDPDLKNFSMKSRSLFFLAWYRWGDRAELLREFSAHPDWGPSAWPLHCQMLAKEKRFQQAVELARPFVDPPALPQRQTSQAEAERRWYRSPRDFDAAFALAEFRREAADLIGARVVLVKITQRPECPPYFWWLRFNLEALENRWEPAWLSLQNYLLATVKDWPRI